MSGKVPPYQTSGYSNQSFLLESTKAAESIAIKPIPAVKPGIGFEEGVI
jgi:hypothetical protein